jgi:hypothetical protein
VINLVLIIVYFSPKSDTSVYLLDDPKKEQELQNKLGSNASIDVDPVTKTVGSIDFALPQTGTKTEIIKEQEVVASANEFNKQYGEYLGIKDPEKELTQNSVKLAESGNTIVKYQQNFNEVPVFGTSTNVHVNNTGNVVAYEGKTVANVDIDTNAKITKEIAQTKALEIFKTYVTKFTQESDYKITSSLNILDAELISLNNIDNQKLTWKVDFIKKPLVNWTIFIDAQSGGLVFSHNNLISDLPQMTINRLVYDCSICRTKVTQAKTRTICGSMICRTSITRRARTTYTHVSITPMFSSLIWQGWISHTNRTFILININTTAKTICITNARI